MRLRAGAPTPTWVQRASRAQTLAGAGLCFAIVLVLLIGLDVISATHPGFYLPALIVDGLTAAVCGVLVLRLMEASQARHRALIQRLEMIAEMNHHIRNALEEIQLSAHTTHDGHLIQNIQTAVGRIEWALREILSESPSGSTAKPVPPQIADREIDAGTPHER
jgi:signal transduction histidine kinase